MRAHYPPSFSAFSGIAFDLEGTIIDLEEIHRQAWREAAAAAGLDHFDVLPDFLGAGDEAVAAHVEQRTSACAAEILGCKKGIYCQLRAAREIIPRDGWLQAYQESGRRGMPMVIGTSTARGEAAYLLERSGLSSLFDAACVVTAEDVPRRKPAPDVFLETARRLGISPCQQLVFEDSAVGIEAAKAALSSVVAVPPGREVIPVLERHEPLFVFEDWRVVCSCLSSERCHSLGEKTGDVRPGRG